MSASQSLRAETAKRIIIKDGAYGTSIQNKKLQSADYCGGLDLLKDQRGNNDLLNITKPEVVRAICESFADAGAEILATNTFNANAISQADYGAEALVTKINIEAARITREVADRDAERDQCGALQQSQFRFHARYRAGDLRRAARLCGGGESVRAGGDDP